MPQSTVACPTCQTQVIDDGTFGGQTVRCPACANLFRMPAATLPLPTLWIPPDLWCRHVAPLP